MAIYFKLHPKHIAYLINDKVYGIIKLSTPIQIGVELEKLFTTTTFNYLPVYIEQPYIVTDGPKIQIYHNIQLLQRTAGIIEYLSHKYLAQIPIYLIHEKTKPSVSERLLMVDKLLIQNNKFYTTTEMLSLADTLLLYLAISRPRASQTPKTPLQKSICEGIS